MNSIYLSRIWRVCLKIVQHSKRQEKTHYMNLYQKVGGRLEVISETQNNTVPLGTTSDFDFSALKKTVEWDISMW